MTGVQADLTTALGLEDKDLVLFVADTLEVANATLGALRGRIAKELGLIDTDKFNFLWVVDWPMFEWSEEEGRYMSAHHPFTLPQADTAHELEGELANVRAIAYDIVLNGYELGGGSFVSTKKNSKNACSRPLDSQQKKQMTSLVSFWKLWTMDSHHTVAWLLDLTAL